MLHNRYAEELGWLTIDKTSYENEDVCQFVANVALYTHAEYVDRESRGMRINVSELEKDEISNKVKERLKGEQRKENFKKTFSVFNIFKKK